MKAFVANPGKRAGEQRKRINPLPLLVGNPQRRSVSIMSKKKTNKKSATSHGRPAGKNPLGKPRRRRSHRNPFMGESLSANLASLGAGAVGLLADVYLPAWALALLGQPDTGWLSYLLAAAVVVIPAYALDKANLKAISKAYFIGAGSGLVWRVIDNLTGQQYVQVESGMGSFLIPANPPLPGPNVFPAGRQRMMLPPASTGSTGAASGMNYLMHAA